MDGVLSQEEINALLNNNDAADSSDEILTESEKDAIGEIANISMGTAATCCGDRCQVGGRLPWVCR